MKLSVDVSYAEQPASLKTVLADFTLDPPIASPSLISLFNLDRVLALAIDREILTTVQAIAPLAPLSDASSEANRFNTRGTQLQGELFPQQFSDSAIALLKEFAQASSRMKPAREWVQDWLLNVSAEGLDAYPGTPGPTVGGQLIVKFRPDVAIADINAFRASLNATLLHTAPASQMELWAIQGLSPEQAAELYQQHPLVAFMQPDYSIELQTILLSDPNAVEPAKTAGQPNDPNFSRLWGIHNTGQTGGAFDADIDALEAWSFSTGKGVVIGVIDSGVDYTHPDLVNNIWTNPGEIPGNGIDDEGNGYIDDYYGWDFVNNDNDPFDDNGHGTHVAGTIAAQWNNGIGVSGVAPEAKIMALKFLNASSSGSTFNAIRAIEYATQMGAHLTNNSWGGGGYSQALYDAIATAGQAGQLFIAAAGNGGSDAISDNNDSVPRYPANYNLGNIITVAATDSKDQLALFSNFGAASVDLAAPGVSIFSTTPNGKYASYSGTSMATPHVTGAAALLWSQNPDWTAQQVKERLLATVDPVAALQGKTLTGGRLNAFNAVQPETIPGSLVALQAESADSFTRVVTVPNADVTPAIAQSTMGSIQVTYSGFTPEAQAAFEYAVDIWESRLLPNVTIEVQANWLSLEPTILGVAGANNFHRNFQGAAQGNTWYPAALANHLAYQDLSPNAPEIVANFNSSLSNWYFGTDAQTPAGYYDFVSVVLHELGHGLGFTGLMQYDANTGFGSWGMGTGSPGIYDRFTVTGANTNLINTAVFPNGSLALGQQLTSNDLFFNGPNAIAANKGNLPKLYTPGSWDAGSSYTHLDEATYGAGNLNSLMTPKLSKAEAIHDPGPIALGIFQDMGWTTTASLMAAQASPLNLGFESGDFTDWQMLGDVAIATAESGSRPTEGLYQAQLATGAGAVAATELSTFLGLDQPISSYPDSEDAIVGSALVLDPLTVQAGDILRFDWHAIAPAEMLQEHSSDPLAFVSIASDTLQVLQELANPPGDGVQAGNSIQSETGYRTFSYTFAEAGTYTIGMSMLQGQDSLSDSALFIDNISIVSSTA